MIRRTPRVLIVDDDTNIRLMILASLRRRRFELLQAANGSDALAMMRAAKPDLVIMDLWMPEASGWDILHERALEPLLLRIPVIVITADSSADVKSRVLAERVSALLSKPFDLGALMSAVSACLGVPESPDLVAA